MTLINGWLMNLILIKSLHFFVPRDLNVVVAFMLRSIIRSTILRPRVQCAQYYTLLNQLDCRYFVR